MIGVWLNCFPVEFASKDDIKWHQMASNHLICHFQFGWIQETLSLHRNQDRQRSRYQGCLVFLKNTHGNFSPKKKLWIRLSAKLDADKRLVVSISQPGNLKPRSLDQVSAGMALVRQHLLLVYHHEASLNLREKRKGVVSAILTIPVGSNLAWID